ncbi:hypothetical protein [Streptomyces genisteinicus]|uniref:Uncharacterized protein n=1 Tax=Streptomyces genisteinicus TaxID=2768068 RepID=A0A7H0HRF1_9ACTN|nr:hypothetical protein [Streptomyces genisteinicus]QNP63117.1 hypothetical protein IAG43_09310 [Streptomyces genisteinicus]
MNAQRHWSPILDDIPPVRIPSPCWAAHPARYLNCTRPPGHSGDHEDCYDEVRWTNTGRDPQW